MDNVTAERKAKRVVKNTAAQGVRFASVSVSKLLIGIVIARVSGPEALGQFSFVMTFTLALSILNNFGLGMLMMRDIAQQHDRIHAYVDHAMSLGAIMGGFSVIVMTLAAGLLRYPGDMLTAIFLTAVANWIDTQGNLYVAAFSGFERMELGALSIVIQEIAFFILGAVVLIAGLPFMWIYVVYILSRFISLVACVKIYRDNWGRWPRFGFEWRLIKDLMRRTLPFAVTTAFSPVFARIDLLMLGQFIGNTAVGLYEVASTLFYRMNVFARTINLAIMPLIAHEYPTHGRGVVRYVERAVKIQAVLALPITAASWALGRVLIIAVYGGEFEPTVIAFQIMASVMFLRFVNHVLGVTLSAVNLEHKRSTATFWSALLNVGLNLYAIPHFSFLGAAVTSALSEIIFFFMQWYYVMTRLPNPIHPRTLIKPGLASIVMAVPLWLLRDASLLITVPLALALYAAAVVALRVLTPEEMEFVLKVTRLGKLMPPPLRRRLMPNAVKPGAVQE